MIHLTTGRPRARKPFATLALVLTLAASGAAAGTLDDRYAFSIGPQSLSSALLAFSELTDIQVSTASADLKNLKSPGVTGKRTASEALQTLFAGTELTFRVMADNTVAVEPRKGRTKNLTLLQRGDDVSHGVEPRSAEDTSAPAAADRQSTGGHNAQDQPMEIVVTGTLIRGIGEVENLAALAVKITREEWERAGIGKPEDLFRHLPQNFDSYNLEAASGIGNGAAGNAIAHRQVSGVNLRGLGAGSTLVLVNGRRRAASPSGVADITDIPMSMLQRVEIVTGGRSAMYGSDAVGGVVNFTTRRDFKGLEVQGEYGAAHYGDPRFQTSVLTGISRERGGFALGYDFFREGQFDAVETGRIAIPNYQNITYMRLPLRGERERHALMLSGRFDPRDGLEFFAEGLYSQADIDRVTQDRRPGASQDSVSRTLGDNDQYNFSAGVRLDLPAAWQLTADTQIARAEVTPLQTSFVQLATSSSFSSNTFTDTYTEEAMVLQFEGPLASIGAIRPRLAIGAEARRSQAGNVTQELAVSSNRPLIRRESESERDILAVFAEAAIPLVKGGARRGLRSLQLSLAGRYEDYSDFGRAFSPQAGVIWEPVVGVRLRGAYSEAFRASAVTLQPEGTLTVLTAIMRPDPLQPGGSSPVLQYLGSQPGIGPEEAKTWSLGLDFTPRFMSAGKFSLSYFNIDYRERIGQPALGVDLALVLERENRFPGLVNRSPTAADIDALLAIRSTVSNSTGTPIAEPVTGASVLAAFPDLVLFDGRTANLAVEKVDGIDLTVERRLDTGLGRIELGLNGNYTFNHFSRLTAVSPAIEGLDEVSKPVQFRVRARASWQRDRWSANTYLNHSPAYNNPFVTPTGRVRSWTTVDFTLGLDVGGLLRGGFLPDDMRLSLTARNLLDRRPPLLVGALANTLLYDPTNANAEGRILALRVVSRW